MTKPSPGITGFNKADCIALKTAHAVPISRYACVLFILSEIQLLPRVKKYKKNWPNMDVSMSALILDTGVS